jgi:hypothetical protein
MQAETVNPGDTEHFTLLQLPRPALSCVLQKLDRLSLAYTAMSCSTLSGAAAQALEVKLKCHSDSGSVPEKFVQFVEFAHRVATEQQLPLQLTHLSLNFTGQDRYDPSPKAAKGNFSQLSGLVNLEDFHLTGFWRADDPKMGGLPAQWVKLTSLCLDINAPTTDFWNGGAQLQHLSSFTALRQLSVCVKGVTADALAGLQHLSQLTALTLSSSGLQLSTSNTSSWACLTALQRLNLGGGAVQADVLPTFTALQALSFTCNLLGDVSTRELCVAVSQLTLLTELYLGYTSRNQDDRRLGPNITDVTSGLTASTNLRSLELGWYMRVPLRGCVLFLPGAVYPHLTKLDLQVDPPDVTRWLNTDAMAYDMPLSQQQLQLLCSSCPAVECLAFSPSARCASPSGLLPLLQLSALTSLSISNLGNAAAVTAAAGIAAQLTRLKQLSFLGLSYLPLYNRGYLALLELSHSAPGLTALRAFTLIANHAEDGRHDSLFNTVSTRCLVY